MKGVSEKNNYKRVLAAVLSFILMISLISVTVPVYAATETHPDYVTISVSDEDGNPVSDATVEYTIVNGVDNYANDSKQTDNYGTVDILASSNEIIGYKVTAIVTKNDYKRNTEISDKIITDEEQDIKVTLIKKREQNIEFENNHESIVDFDTTNSGNNIYSFKAICTTTANPISYNVQNVTEGDNRDISEIASIDNDGNLTVLAGGYNIKVIATVAGDDEYSQAKAEFVMSIKATSTDLISFNTASINYTVGTSDVVSNQAAVKSKPNDNGAVTYSATANVAGAQKELSVVGLGITGSSVKVSDYDKLCQTLVSNGTPLQINVKATKSIGTGPDNQQMYGSDETSYTINIYFESTPENPYTLLDMDGNTLTAPNGSNGWYNSSVKIKPAEGYKVARDTISSGFSNNVVFGNENDQGKNVQKIIYLKNESTGGVTTPIKINNVNIDNICPENINIKFPELQGNESQNDGINYYGDKIEIEFTAQDSTSGIDYYTWEYTRAEGASDINLASDSGTAIPSSGNKATIILPAGAAQQLNGTLKVSATDKAGNTSDKVNSNKFAIDTLDPTINVEFELADEDKIYIFDEEAYGNTHYYSGDVKFTVNIQETNFNQNRVKIKVKKDSEEVIDIRSLRWVKQLNSDNYETTFDINNGDGDYIVEITYKDYTGREMTYVSPKIVIDKTVPIIAFDYNSLEQIATVTITEHNFDPSNIELSSLIAKDINGNDIFEDEENNNNYRIELENFLQNCEWVQDEQNKDKYSAKISTKFVDAIYTLKINYKDIVLNPAEGVETDTFIVDRTAPDINKIKIDYSKPLVKEQILSNITFGYYNPMVTVTFTGYDDISGLDFFTWSYSRQRGASEINLNSINEKVYAVQDSSDKSKFTATITMPLSDAQQLKGSIAVSATDKFANTSDLIDEKGYVIVVDTIAPTRTVEYSQASKTSNGKSYYNKPAILTFKINEANFDYKDVEIYVTKNGKPISLKTNWSDKDVDNHEGILVIPAAANHSNDGEYIVKLSYTDKSKNKMTEYISNTIVIDTHKPVISVDYSNTNPVNVIKDSDGHNRKYYTGTQTATIKIVEKNFNKNNVKFEISAKNVKGKDLNLKRYIKKSSWKSEGNTHKITITYPGDANYSFNVSYIDEATNESSNYKTDYFTVDNKAPDNLNVSYSKSILGTIIDNASFGFYNSKVKVTISAEDATSKINSFIYSYENAPGVSIVNAELINQILADTDITYSNGGKRATATFEIPRTVLSDITQFNGFISFKAIDRSNNQSADYRDTKRIVVDNIAPTAEVSYSTPVQTVDGIAYYDGDINATINITEANFYTEDVEVTATKDGESYPVSTSWSDSSVDAHVGTFTLTEDGDYIITINYVDKSSNEMQVYKSEQLTIDTDISEPVITVNGQEANGMAFRNEVIPSVSFEDKNLDSYELKLTRTRYEDIDSDVTELFIKDHMSVDFKTGIGKGEFDEFNRIQDNDGIYTLSVLIRDKSGHEIEKSATFTVNRYGSVYVYDDYLVGLIADGGAFVKNVDSNLIITEYNPDKLVEESLNIEISCDGKPLEAMKTIVSPEINSNATTGASGWYQYQYTIDKANFSTDGIYKILISSKDNTGNTPQNTNYEDKEIIFHVDSSAPEINSITGLEEPIINATEVDVKYTIYDAMALESVVVYLDGNQISNITNFHGDLNNYAGGFTLDESTSAQDVRIVVTDKAGNVTDTDASDFSSVYAFNSKVMISTNVFVRWFANKVLFIGSIIGILTVLGGLYFGIAYRRKRKD